MAALLGGPGVVGVVVLIGYARGVLSSAAREAGHGWRTFGVGAVLVVWFVVFLVLSTGGVIGSWTADGAVKPEYVILTATWLVGIALLVVTLWNARRTARYISDSYHTGDWPLPARLLRWLFRL